MGYPFLNSTPENEYLYPGDPTRLPPRPITSIPNPIAAPKMASSIVDFKKPGPNYSYQSIYDLLDLQEAKSQEELARQQRRVAAQGMVNGLGNVVKSLFSAYGASKGAPISPVKGTSQQDNARMDELWNAQMNMDQRQNAQKLQLMLEDMRTKQETQQYWDRYGVSKADQLAREQRDEDAQIRQEGRNEETVKKREGRMITAEDEKNAKEFELWKQKLPLETEAKIKEYQSIYGPGGARPYLDPATGKPWAKAPAAPKSLTEKKEMVLGTGKDALQFTSGDADAVITWAMDNGLYDPEDGELDYKNPVDRRLLIRKYWDNFRQSNPDILMSFDSDTGRKVPAAKAPGRTITPTDYKFPWNQADVSTEPMQDPRIQKLMEDPDFKKLTPQQQQALLDKAKSYIR